MRRQEQLGLDRPEIEHVHARELAEISRMLDAHPDMAERVGQDLVRDVSHPETGARGLTGDQVLRILVVKQMNGFSYAALAFHRADSVSYRRFCRFGALEKTPARATVAENLKKVSEATLEAIQRGLVRHAAEVGVERGRTVRVDATVCESNIHAPTDSGLLWDGVRVLTRLVGRAEGYVGVTAWSDPTKRAKRRALAVQYARSRPKRVAAYRDLLKVTRKSVGYAVRVAEELDAAAGERAATEALAAEIRHYVELIRRVIDQTERRVIRGERVSAAEKVVSLFEPHTDIVRKDRRETLYGHKLDLTAGAFASRENLREAKALGVEDVVFQKKRGLRVPEMAKSAWVYRRLRDFRAGIEGIISYLKRVFGLDRCTWRGAASFGAYVMASVVSANLLALARHALA